MSWLLNSLISLKKKKSAFLFKPHNYFSLVRKYTKSSSPISSDGHLSQIYYSPHIFCHKAESIFLLFSLYFLSIVCHSCGWFPAYCKQKPEPKIPYGSLEGLIRHTQIPGKQIQGRGEHRSHLEGKWFAWIPDLQTLWIQMKLQKGKLSCTFNRGRNDD